MADYAIGDVQGCYEGLQRLLSKVHFDKEYDRLWFVGDLVNRGPQSLAVLRFIKQLPIPARITLGNHDLHLLNRLFGSAMWGNEQDDDSLQEIVNADDRDELGHWLRQQPVLYHDQSLNVVMCHAGIAPCWDLVDAKARARELEQILSGPRYGDYLTQMYGNEPNYWSSQLKGIARLRLICNYFTRMRFCDKEGRLDLTYKGTIAEAPPHLYPWYSVPGRRRVEIDIVFGHWAALRGQCSEPHLYAIDTGYYWGGELTALRLQDKKRFVVSKG